MTSTVGSTANQSDHDTQSHRCCNWSGRGNWSGLNIAAMVLAFILFWPVGLLILYWIIKGRSVKELPQAIGDQWTRMTRGWNGDHEKSSDNVVFNEYQQTQYDRIREIKDEIKERSRRFTAFREDAKRRADEEEFNRFMAEAPARDNG